MRQSLSEKRSVLFDFISFPLFPWQKKPLALSKKWIIYEVEGRRRGLSPSSVKKEGEERKEGSGGQWKNASTRKCRRLRSPPLATRRSLASRYRPPEER